MVTMKPEFPDIDRFERLVFKKKQPLDFLLSFSMKLMQARNAGLLYGTDRTGLTFLPPDRWDRGVLHKLDGRGLSGVWFKYVGPFVTRVRGLSPVRLYREDQFGEIEATDGIIAFVLRTYKDFYKNGLNILLMDDIPGKLRDRCPDSDFSIYSYNGGGFTVLSGLKVNKAIVRQFKADNFLSAYIPDYGAIVFNSIHPDLLFKKDGVFMNESDLTHRLKILISAIEMASIAYLGSARGRQAAHIIWRKEKNLRKAALELKQREIQLNVQKEYLRALGAVDEAQLNMKAVNISDGVYAFIDMVGSETIRTKFQPMEYFYILNLCHQIAANNAARFACRVDNFIGDSVFLISAPPFDPQDKGFRVDAQERIMLMIFAVTAIFNEIQGLTSGFHEMDPEGRVQRLIESSGLDIGYRAGVDVGSAMIGPLGSRKRKIVTAIGKAVSTASRLESSGLKNEIHITGNILKRLKDAQINRSMTILWKILSENKVVPSSGSGEAALFFDCYQRFFGISRDVVYARNNISYKEFSSQTSYMMKCIPDSAGT